MLFNSWPFLLFLVLLLPAYYGLSGAGAGVRAQTALLFAASLFFYSYTDPFLLPVLLGSLLINSIAAHRMTYGPEEDVRKWRWIGVTANLALLGTFKYARLLANTFLPDSLADLRDALASIPLPIGISFFTFQAISLVVDTRPGVRRSGGVPETSSAGEWFTRIGFYISFFPQLIAGPIVKAHEFLPQIAVKRLSTVRWWAATRALTTGYFLKVVVADNLKEATALMDTTSVAYFGRFDLMLLLYGYSFQIFADFAGYSLIAIGLAALFGYNLPVNFRFPYIASSFSDFWRRWHISLSTWLRDYLYIPLGGNRKGSRRTYFNLFIVMLLGGLWHGAAWRYLVWGGLHGIALALERLVLGPTPKTDGRLWVRIVRSLLVFHVVTALWLTFALSSWEQLGRYLERFVEAPWALFHLQSAFSVALFSAPVILYHLAAAVEEAPSVSRRFAPVLERAAPVLTGVMLFVILVNGGLPGEFIYFQF